MAFKLAVIGAGSVGFTRVLLSDILTVPEFRNIEIHLTDISEFNLQLVTQLCQRDIDENGLSIKLHATTNRREAISGAKYIINCSRVGGLEGYAMDVEIPLKYGVDQCVGDTLCAGGIMYGQRGIAAMLDFCKDIREVAAPGALLLNYGNPNAMLTWTAIKYGKVKAVGLCHGVQSGHGKMEKALGIDRNEIDIICAGLNHQTWYISVKHKGEDLLPKLLPALEAHPLFSVAEKTRIDVLRNFGYFSTESNGHLSEYLMWYRKRPDDLLNWISLENSQYGDYGETGGNLRVVREGRNWFETDFPKWMEGPPQEFVPANRSNEHGSYIMEGLETGRIYRGHFNVMNNGTITNLPDECIVEVPGYVDGNGISIPKVGDLPLGCAAICSQTVWVQRLAVEAAVAGDINLLRQAMLMDPLTGAVCNPPEIRQLVDEMLVAQAKWLPQYAGEIEGAKARLAEKRIPPRDYQGFRVKEKTVEEMRKNAAEAG